MSGAIRIETVEWRVGRVGEGARTFATEQSARKHAARLEAQNMPHLGRIPIQSRRVIVSADHWADTE